MRSGDRQRDYLVATQLYKEGRYEDALRLLDELHRDRPDSKHVLYYKGLCLSALGRLTEATATCDCLSTHQSDSGRRLTAKLSAEIADRVRLDYIAGQAAKNGFVYPAPVTTSSDDGRMQSRQVSQSRSRSKDYVSEPPSRSWKRYLIVAGLIACLSFAMIVFNIHRRQARLAEEAAENAPLPIPDGPVPDKYLEVVNFYPADRDRAYRFVMFLTPWDEFTPPPDTGAVDECVGNAVVSEWPSMERDMGRALHASGGVELLAHVPRDRMVRTLVLPRQAQGFTRPLQEIDVKTFIPGTVADMAAVIATCGKPTRVESWEHNAQCVALNGKVHWWGRVGVAVDSGAGNETGAITHVLIREYPKAQPTQ